MRGRRSNGARRGSTISDHSSRRAAENVTYLVASIVTFAADHPMGADQASSALRLRELLTKVLWSTDRSQARRLPPGRKVRRRS